MTCSYTQTESGVELLFFFAFQQLLLSLVHQFENWFQNLEAAVSRCTQRFKMIYLLDPHLHCNLRKLELSQVEITL
jgi:hypothetical protein